MTTSASTTTQLQQELVKAFLIQKREAIQWAQQVLHDDDSLMLDPKEDFFNQLMDGVILCKLMQKISL